MSELPKGWVEISISDVADVKGGKRLPKGGSFSEVETSYPYIRVSDFDNGTINTQKLKFIDRETHLAISNYVISSDDLYISIAGTIGLVGDIPKTLDGANLTENAAKLCNLHILNKDFLKYFLQSPSALQQFIDKTTSSGQPKLALFRIKDCSLGLAPLAEQKRIVETLDEVLAQVDTIKARLDGIPGLLKRFRQSVLASAVSGKLTEEWRGISCLEDVSGTVETVVHNNSHKAKPYEPSVPPYSIEPTWKWCRLGDIVTLKSGKTIKASEEKEAGTIPYYKVGDMNAPENQFYMSKADKFVDDCISKKSLLPANTIIFPKRGGAIGTNKKRILSIESLVDLNTMGIIIPDEFDMKYFYRWFETIDLASLNTGSTIPQVNNGDIEPLWVPVPPVEEQKEIVRLVDQYFAFADTIEAQVKKAQARVDKLTQSILAKAFRGELVAQDPNDEPADKLLERIAEARKEAEALAKAAKKAEAAKKRAAKSA